MKYSDCKIDALGDCCKGDIVTFTESVFSGSYRSPRYIGERKLMAKITGCSYGLAKQQHTFSFELIKATGTQAQAVNSKFRRKARNVYRNGVKRAAWEFESDRQSALDEKHKRGDEARARRQKRINSQR